MRQALAFLSLLFVLLLPASAQTGIVWGPAHPFDTGVFQPNPTVCTPDAPPTEWDRVDVPLPPDGTLMVRTKITRFEYGVDMTVTNLTAVPAMYMTSGLYHARIGHAPGLYHHEGHLYGSGQVIAVGAGVGPIVNEVDGGGTEEVTYTTVYDALTTTDIDPISPEWLTPNRRGAHSLWVTVQGGYDWGWYGNGHNPFAYSMADRVRVVGSVEYGRAQ